MACKSGKRAGVKVSLVLLSVFLFLLLFASVAFAATYGDINDDGEINVQDVVLVMKHVLELDELTVAQEAVADVNGDGNINVQDVTLIMQYSLGLIDEFPHAALTVSKVTAVNPKQVEVEFNRVLNADEKAKMVAANFHLGLQAASTTNVLTGAGSAVAVLSDSKTVLLTMANGSNFVNGSSTNRVVVKQAVGIAADYVNASVPFVDTTIPILVSVHTESPRDIVLTFSEPLDHSINPATNITLNGGTVALNLFNPTYVSARRELRIQSFSDLPTGSHTLAITSGTTLQDYSAFRVAPASKTFTHTPLTTPPTVEAISSTETSVTLRFSRAINTATFKDNARLIFRHTFDSTIAQVTGEAATNPSGDNRTFVVDFGGKILPPGVTTVWMKYLDGTTDAQKAKDTWGNVIAPATFTVNTVPDTTPPTATVTLVSGSNTVIEIQYSKAVNGAQALLATNYVLKKGTADVPFTGPVVHDAATNKYRITANSAMVGTHTLTISNIKDITPAQNAMGTQTYTINVPDTTPPTVLGTSKLLPGSSNKVQVFFSEEMNVASITDRSKYTYNIGGSDIAVPAAVILTPASNGKSVLLDFSSTAVTFIVSNKITVGRVKDLAGNDTAALSTVTTIAAGEYIGLEKAEATAVNRITLTIDALISNISPFDFAINPGDATYAKAASLISVSYSAGKTFIVLSTASNLPYNAAGVSVRTESAVTLGQGATANARDEFGNKLNFNNAVVSDKIAPILLTAKRLNDNTIELTFSEDLDANTFAPALSNGFSVAGSTIHTNSKGVGERNKVTVTRVSGGLFTVGTTQIGYTAGNVADSVGNKLVSYSPVSITN